MRLTMSFWNALDAVYFEQSGSPAGGARPFVHAPVASDADRCARTSAAGKVVQLAQFAHSALSGEGGLSPVVKRMHPG